MTLILAVIFSYITLYHPSNLPGMARTSYLLPPALMLDLKKIEQAIKLIAIERKLPESDLLEIIEAAIRTAYKRDFWHKDEAVNVSINFKEEVIEVTTEKTVVETVENNYTEIALWELDEEDGFEIGDVIEIDVSEVLEDNKAEFGRIASQAAKQVIIQKIGESEKKKVYEVFKDKQGDIVSVKVDMVENNKIFLDYNGTQVLLPRWEQVSRDKYIPGSRFYAYVKKVEDEDGTDSRVILSRKDVMLVVKLFENNTPELEDGSVEVVRIVREPGFKTKLIVASEFEEIDPAGALIWPAGQRVKLVVEELSGEKVDVLNYTDNDREMIAAALNPAEIIDVKIDNEQGTALVLIPKDEETRAIGRWGANVRLAEQLTGFRISLTTPEKLEAEENKAENTAETEE